MTRSWFDGPPYRPHPGGPQPAHGGPSGGFVPLVILLALAAPGCGEEDPDDFSGGTPVKVMTRNLFLGADLQTVVLADGLGAVPAQVHAFWQDVLATDVPARMQRLAAEIAVQDPDLVGLQEVTAFFLQDPSDFDLNTPVINANTVAFDFLALLQAALAAAGKRYVAFENPLSDVELPGQRPDGTRYDVRMIDRDVILVREGLPVSNLTQSAFDNYISFPIGTVTPTGFKPGPGIPTNLKRGYAHLTVTMGGRPFVFVNTHLEVGGIGALAAFQEAQANELVALLEAISAPTILVGDVNSPADGTGTRSYRFLADLMKDAWVTATTPTVQPGNTCCVDLADPAPTRSSRIDVILMRGGVRADAAVLTGVDPAERTTTTNLWPSDHAGVAAQLAVRP